MKRRSSFQMVIRHDNSGTVADGTRAHHQLQTLIDTDLGDAVVLGLARRLGRARAPSR